MVAFLRLDSNWAPYCLKLGSQFVDHIIEDDYSHLLTINNVAQILFFIPQMELAYDLLKTSLFGVTIGYSESPCKLTLYRLLEFQKALIYYFSVTHQVL